MLPKVVISIYAMIYNGFYITKTIHPTQNIQRIRFLNGKFSFTSQESKIQTMQSDYHIFGFIHLRLVVITVVLNRK